MSREKQRTLTVKSWTDDLVFDWLAIFRVKEFEIERTFPDER